jgi:hypothetical protein
VQPLVTELTGDDGTGPLPWTIHPDLLISGDGARHAVVELDEAGATTLRFGDDENGARPDSGTAFTIRYRVGNGPQGNVGAEGIRHVVSPDARIPFRRRGGWRRKRRRRSGAGRHRRSAGNCAP